MKQIVTTSTQPYFIRALYEWILDNNLMPYLSVDATMTGVIVPTHTIKNGQVTLNISPTATHKLTMNNEYISFSARFGGVSRDLFIPIYAVLGIFARETGQGLFFEGENPTISNDSDTQPAIQPAVDTPKTNVVTETPKPTTAKSNKKPFRLLD